MNKRFPLRDTFSATGFIVSFIALNIWCVCAALGDFPSFFDQTKFFSKMLFVFGVTACILLSINKYLSMLCIALNGFLTFCILDWNAFMVNVPTIRALRTVFVYDLAGQVSFIDYIDCRILALCILFLAIQYICHAIYFCTKRRWKPIIVLSGCSLLFCFFIAYGIRHQTMPWEFGTWSLSTSIERRGYLITWFAELCDQRDYHIEQTCANEKIEALPLFPVEEKFLVVQVECLDYLLVHYLVKNVPLMPTLSDMANKGLLFKVDGVKKLTSANSDYELLNTRVANAMEVFYSFVETYPDSFASFFAGKGFQTSVYQGFSGTYANARNGYQKMGTNHLYFLEELRKSGLPPDSRTIQQNLAQYIDDRLVFAFAGDDLPIDRFFGVLITMNMHDPKEGFVLPEFKGEKHDESLTVIRETDDAFKALLEKIPDGTTLLVIGDHIPYHGLRSRHIPCLFYKKGEDLSVLNRKIPVDTVYTRCEMSQYVRRLFGMPDVSAHVPVCKK